jgi:hypothetical protein
LSRMRSPMTSRSNCAKDNRTFRVKRPIDRLTRSLADLLVDHHDVDPPRREVSPNFARCRAGQSRPEGRRQDCDTTAPRAAARDHRRHGDPLGALRKPGKHSCAGKRVAPGRVTRRMIATRRLATNSVSEFESPSPARAERPTPLFREAAFHGRLGLLTFCSKPARARATTYQHRWRPIPRLPLTPTPGLDGFAAGTSWARVQDGRQARRCGSGDTGSSLPDPKTLLAFCPFVACGP